MFTMGAVIVRAAAPEPQCSQLAVEFLVDVGPRVHKHGGGFAIRQVAAVMGRRREEDQRSEIAHSFLRPGPAPVEGPVFLFRFLIHVLPRSEERRVGKECRSQWSLYP